MRDILVKTAEIVYVRSPILPLRGNVLCAMKLQPPQLLPVEVVLEMLDNATANAVELGWSPRDGTMLLHIHGEEGEVLTVPTFVILAAAARTVKELGDGKHGKQMMEVAIRAMSITSKRSPVLYGLLMRDDALEITPAPAVVREKAQQDDDPTAPS